MDQFKKPAKLKKKNSVGGKIFECILLAFLFIMFVLPFYYMIISSFKTTFEAMATKPVFWPSKWVFTNFRDAWKEANFSKYGLNSIIISGSVVVTCLLCSVPAAFAFGRLEFKFKKPLFAIILSDMMVPIQCIFLPLFLVFAKLGMLNTYGSMILLFTYSGSTIFFIRNAFMQVNNEVLESARLDGASELAVMFKVTFPMVKPVVVTMALMAFLRRWNDYFWNLSLTTNDKVRTLPYAIKSLNAATDGALPRWEVTMDGATLLMAPMLIAYIFANRQIKNAFVYSGIK